MSVELGQAHDLGELSRGGPRRLCRPDRTAAQPQDRGVTLTPQQTRGSKSAPRLDPQIVRDARWPSMYRIRLSDGSLSDMVNLTRAKDALLWRTA
jgi:hypothetical protein